MSTKLWTTRSSSETLALRWGNASSASTTARVMNGRYVRPKPSVDFHSAFTALRARSTLAKSTSTTLNACGLTLLLITMWLPVSLRIFDNRTVESRSPGATVGAGAAAAGADGAATAGAAGAGAVGAGAAGAGAVGAGAAGAGAVGAGAAGAGCVATLSM